VKRNPVRHSARVRIAATALLIFALGGCASMGSSGPSGRAIAHAGQKAVATAPIQIIKVNEAVARRVLAAHRASLFSVALGDAPSAAHIIGRGDVLQVTIWEAPPAVLFGSNTSFGGATTSPDLGGASLGQRTGLPDMMVGDDGRISVPFAGAVPAAGRTPREVEEEIVARLRGKAHDPQVAVRITTNASADVTVVGDVATNGRIPLTPKGERLLDVLAMAGPRKGARYVVFHTFDRDADGMPYYESLDFSQALHPQTLLALQQNGAPITPDRGAPVRLKIPTQLGYKSAKWVRHIAVVPSLGHLFGGKGGYWEDQGYQWYAGI